MADSLYYKGYHAKPEWVDEDRIYYGKILGISDLVDFTSESANGLKNAFCQAVDDYLDFCRKCGKEPQKPTCRVVLVEPGKAAEITEMELSLKNMQKTVGGLIQAVYPWEDKVALVCNDEGKLLGLPPNRALEDENGDIYDIVHGTFFICGLTEDDFGPLTNEQAELYLKKFRNPQAFMYGTDGTIFAIERHEFKE